VCLDGVCQRRQVVTGAGELDFHAIGRVSGKKYGHVVAWVAGAEEALDHAAAQPHFLGRQDCLGVRCAREADLECVTHRALL
jgi:hypothetical protein